MAINAEECRLLLGGDKVVQYQGFLDFFLDFDVGFDVGLDVGCDVGSDGGKRELIFANRSGGKSSSRLIPLRSRSPMFESPI